MQFFRNFPVAKKFMDKRLGGGNIKTFRQKFFLSLCRNLSYGNHFVQCFRFFAVAKKFMDKGGWAGIKIFRRIIFHSLCRKTSQGNIYGFSNFRYRKMLWIEERGEHQKFPAKSFCVIVLNNS